MNIVDYLKSKTESERKRFISIFKRIDEESSEKLLKQMEERTDTTKTRLKHAMTREAKLKEAVIDVAASIKALELAEVDIDDINQLKGWREEIFGMIDNIEYKNLEEKITKLTKIKRRILSRSPFLNRIKAEFGNDFK